MAPQGDGARFLERAAWGAGLMAGAALLLAIWFTRNILLLAFAGILLAVLLRAPADLLSRHTGMPASVAVGLVTLVLLGMIVGLFWWRGGEISSQAAELREQIPVAAERIEANVRTTTWGRALTDNLPDAEAVLPEGSNAIRSATGVLSRTFTLLTNFLIIGFLGIVLALTPGVYIRGVVRLVPPGRRDRAREILARLASTLRWWLLGRLISMAVIGVLTGIGLMLLGVPLAMVLAVLAALLSFIPNLGPVLSAVPAVLLGLVQSPRLALAVVGLYAGVQFLESYILAPIIDRKTIYLPPALTVLAQFLMATVAGLLGVALATPLLAAIVVLVGALYIEDALGDRIDPDAIR